MKWLKGKGGARDLFDFFMLEPPFETPLGLKKEKLLCMSFERRGKESMMHPSLTFIGILKQKGNTQGYRLSQDRILGRKGRRYV
jgi:hypothetical protein